jgi:hypothetical protein
MLQHCSGAKPHALDPASPWNQSSNWLLAWNTPSGSSLLVGSRHSTGNEAIAFLPMGQQL